MYQQNSIDYSQLLEKTVTTNYNGQVKLKKLIKQGWDEAFFQVSNVQTSNNFILKYQKNKGDQEKLFIEELMKYQNDQDHSPKHSSGIIKIIETFQSNKYHLFLMEQGTSNLLEYMMSQQNLSNEKKIEICYDLIKPIRFIHEKNLYHQDINLEQFILVGDRFKLIDLGLKIKGLDLSKIKNHNLDSLLYSAPEIIDQKFDYPGKEDTWALGCIFYEIFSGESFIARSEKKESIRQEILNIIENKDKYLNKIKQLKIPENVIKILKKMLKPDPKQRISIVKAFKKFQNIQTEVQVQAEVNPTQQNTNQIPQNKCQQIIMNPAYQTSKNSFQQMNPHQKPPAQLTKTTFFQNQTNQEFQPKGNQLLQTQINVNSLLQTQINANPLLQTQINANPLLQTQININPLLQTQTNLDFQAKGNSACQAQALLQTQIPQPQSKQQIVQQTNINMPTQPIQSATQALLQQQNAQKQLIPQSSTEQIGQQLIDEIRKQISEKQEMENKTLGNQIQENSNQQQSSIEEENFSNSIIHIIQNLKSKVQEIQIQQQKEFQTKQESQLSEKDQEIIKQKLQLEESQQKLEQSQAHKNELEQKNKDLQKIIEKQEEQIEQFKKQQSLNYLVDEVINKFKKYQERQQQQPQQQTLPEQQQHDDDEEDQVFPKFIEEVSNLLNSH